MDDLPDEWEPPAELQSPSKAPFVNFAIIVLSHEKCSNAITIGVAEVLLAKERFTLWYMSYGKSHLDEKALLELSILSGNLLKVCWDAWLEYDAVDQFDPCCLQQLLAIWVDVKLKYEEWVQSRS